MRTLRIAVAMALACGVVWGAAAPAAQAAEGNATFGSQWWTQSALEAKYHEFSEVPRGGFLESFLLREWQGRNTVVLWGANALRADQAAKLTWANGARWRMDLGYTQIPHAFSDIARWGWLQTSPGVFRLPDTLQARNQQIPGSYAQRMQDYLNSAPGVNLGFDTHVSSARLRARPARGWQFETRGTMRERSGLKPYAMSFGFNTALENPEPIDQRMVDADAIASYQRDQMSLQASVGLSSFRNDVSALRVDNPKRITDQSGGDGPRVGVLDLYPDNRVVRGSAALSYMLPRRTALAATLSIAQGKQDDDFLPMWNNSAITTATQSSPDSLPAKHLEGKSTQLNGDVRLALNPSNDLDGTLRFNYTDFDNKTEELNFIGQAPYEATFQRFIQLENHILSNKQWHVGGDLDYALGPRLKLGGLAEYRVRDRTEREVEKDHESVLGGRARLTLENGLGLAARYTHGDRQGDEFLLDEYRGLRTRTAVGSTPNLYDSIGVLEQPGLRRFDVADRVQDRMSADAFYMVGERVDLSATYSFLKNEFGSDTTLGLNDEKVQAVASSATLHVNDDLDLIGGYGFGLTKTNQRSRSSGARMSFSAESTWTARIDEEEVYVFAGIDWAAQPKLSFGVNYEFSRNVTTYDLGNGLNNAADLPQTIFRRHDVTLDARWRWLEKTSLVGRYAFEEYDVNDWATTDVPLLFPASGTASAVFLGDSSRSYRAHRLALLVRHTF